MSAFKHSSARNFSPFLDRLINLHPDWFEQLENSGRLDCASPPEADQLATVISEAGLNPALRQFRNREMLRLIWRDLNNLAAVDEILTDLSTLADICLQAAIQHHTTILEVKHGTPRNVEGQAQKLVVIGLGKLGGGELNLSSDIDIIFCFPDNGICDGRRGFANEQFFTRLARQVIRSLSEITADGFCFRVDTRLRPFGDSGPLVCSFAALEQYYQREGRDWERYAWIKARPVAGDLIAGNQLLGILKPFVYRRYIDFGAIEALREMHANVHEDAKRKDRLDDIKRGPGGIREIEFLVQTFQLLRGGRDKALQTASIFLAAAEIQALQLLPIETISALLAAYRFLRRTENRIQALHDQQTHQVPSGEDGLRVAQAMGFENQEDFSLALGEVRVRVQTLFEQSLPQPATTPDETRQWHTQWQRVRNRIQQDGTGFTDRGPLAKFVKRLSRLSVSHRAATRLDQFMPMLLALFDANKPSDAVIHRVLDLVSAICRRSAYLSLLVQNPGATNRMLELFTASNRIAKVVTRYPALLDELIDPSLGANPPTKKEIAAGVHRLLGSASGTESALLELNYFKQVIILRVSVALLRDSMTSVEAAITLGLLAENLVRAVLQLAQTDMSTRHGQLPGPPLAVIAYGSLGASALGFDSDLDLIFLYQSGDGSSDGIRPVSTERYHTGVARRMLSLLSATTPSGRLYSIDARLRPNGKSGLLVSSLSAFKRYQSEQAWVWELQALTRARPVAGDAEVAKAFAATRKLVLQAPRDNDVAKHEVLNMRHRLRDQHNDANSLKHARGGLVDIQFIAQLGLLLNAGAFPATLESTNLTEQLGALYDCGWLQHDELHTLIEAQSKLSHAQQRAILTDKESDTENIGLLSIAHALCDEILS
jgi:glutamate-ammonia-ligase adenylyltransferase